MRKITQLIRSRYDFLLLFLFAFFAVNEAVNPVSLGMAAVRSVIYAFFFIYLGNRKVRLKGWESFVVLLVNLIFIKLYSGSRPFTSSLFLMSFVLFSCITPMLSRFKNYFAAVLVILLYVSYIVPYKALQVPLFSYLYYPFYILGFELDNIKIKRSALSKWLSIIGIITHGFIMSFIFIKALEKGNPKELRYIYDLYNNKSLFVYSPIVVICFLIIGFSVVNLLLNISDIKKFTGAFKLDMRSACFAVAVITPVLYGLGSMRFSALSAGALTMLAAVLCTLIYWLLKKFLRAPGVEVVRTCGKLRIPLTDLITKWMLILVFTLVQVASVEFVIRGNSLAALVQCMQSASFAYNMLFVLMLFVIASALLGMRLGSVIMVILNVFLLLANFIKIKFFNEPFYLWDTFLIKDALIISKDYINTWTIVVLSLIALTAFCLFVRNIKKVMAFLKPHPHLLLLIIAVGVMHYNLHQLNIYGYAGINVCDTWEDNIQEFFNNGVYVENYMYLKDLDKYFNVKPADYSREKVESVIKPANEDTAVSAKLTSTEDAAQPNIIVILQESFWDPSNLPNVTFNKQIDSNLKKYQNATFVSPVFGGGTANVEFEVLTGFSNFFFNKGIVSYDVYVGHNIMALPQVFKNDGYSTIAIHPNTGEMYSRNKVYNYMGFDKFIDINGFNYDEDKKGDFVSDDRFADKIIGTLNDTSDSKPKFIMGVSIQNHDSYDSATKGYGDTEIKVQSDKLNDQEKDILSNYSQGIYDSDKEIGKVIEAAKKSSRPTLVYVFGDHLPRLGYPLDNYDIYNKTGYLADGEASDSTMKLYETPVVRWASFKKLPALNSPISPNQLAYEILQDSGVSYPGYFDYLKVVADKYPYLNNYLQDKNELLQDDVLKNYYLIQYDLMFGKAYAANSFLVGSSGNTRLRFN